MPAPKGHKPYLGCEKGGRPLKYTVKFIETEADAFELWMQREDSLWYKNFALARGYLPDQFSEWAKTTEKFSRVYRKSQEWQQSKLIKGGLLNKFNAGFTKFVMGNTCGWSDKQIPSSVYSLVHANIRHYSEIDSMLFGYLYS